MSDSDSSDYGPSLPPALAAKKQAAPTGSKAKAAVGPQLPPHLQNRNAADASDDEDDDDVGPAPARAEDANAGVDGVQAFREREERLEKAKEAAANAEPARPKREEWMLVPPKESDLLASMDPTKLKSRGFSTAADAANKRKQEGSSALWTETPAERSKRIAEEQSGKRKRLENSSALTADEEDEARRKRLRDEDLRSTIDAHNKNKRDKTLLAKHNDDLKRQAKQGPVDDGKAPVIWDRDSMLGSGGQLMDDKKRREIIKNATGADGLKGRFGSSGFA